MNKDYIKLYVILSNFSKEKNSSLFVT